MNRDKELELFVEQAQHGNQQALQQIVQIIQDRIYNMALRMLWHPLDAEDATQEILLKVVNHLNQFRYESSFMTWVFRIATNYLLTTRKRRAETTALTFSFVGDVLEAVEEEHAQGQAVSERNDAVDQDLLVKDLQLRCTLGMLLCLDREHRLAYILGEVFEVSSAQGASILEISEAAFRKRVSRARKRLLHCMKPQCQFVNGEQECNCIRHLENSSNTEQRRLATLLTTNPLGASALQPDHGLVAWAHELEQIERVAAIFQSHTQYAPPERMVVAIRNLLASGTFQVFEV